MTTAHRAVADERPARRRILGVRVDDVTWAEALERIGAFARSGVGHHVITPNPEYVMLARADRRVWQLIEHADLALADGVGLLVAARLLGLGLREVVPGSELVGRMAAPAALRGERWFLLGAAQGVAAEAGRRLADANPGLTIAGVHSGSPRPEHDPETCRLIEQCQPVHVLLVAYGAPAQDLWIRRNQERLGIPVAVGVGGTFNFIAGRSRRPPEVVKRLGLIWLFRLVTEPWRWRRQTALARFALLVLREAVSRRVASRRAPK